MNDPIKTTLANAQASVNVHLRKRAAIIELILANHPLENIAEQVGVSLNTVKKWQEAWETDGIAIFPEEVRPSANGADYTVNEEALIEFASEELTEIHPIKLPYHLTIILPESTAILPHDPMWEAGRKLLLFTLREMVQDEPIAIEGVDAEGVHKMRVSVRRMRSIFNVFGEYFEPDYYNNIPVDLRETGRKLGLVRDLDVMLYKTQLYIETELGGNAELLAPLVKALLKQRKQAHKKLLKWFYSKRYNQFMTDFATLAQTPHSGSHERYLRIGSAPRAFQVNHIVPRLLYSKLEDILAYEPFLDEAGPELMHSLRIEFKQLRYHLEFFQEVLGPSVMDVILATRDAQDHLGDLNDAEVATQFAKKVAKSLNKKERKPIKEFIAYRQQQSDELFHTFDHVWAHFNNVDIHKALSNAIAQL